MITTKSTVKKAMLGIFVAIFMVTMTAPTAHAAQTYYYSYNQTGNNAQIQGLLNQLMALIAQLQILQGGGGVYTYPSYPVKPIKINDGHWDYDDEDYDIDVETEDADVDGDDSATLSGDLDLDDAPYAFVWFEYGQDGDLTDETDSDKLTSGGSFDIEVDDLDEDERYYYRAVAEDPSGYRVYGSLDSFFTDEEEDDDDDDNNDDDIPEATTEDAEDIGDDSAELHGEISMNDFEDGLVFFAYGQDEDAVEDVDGENQYGDIDEEGDDLQKVQVYSGLDDTRTFWLTVFGLEEDTDHFYRICVEYEDEDGDDALECGDVESFTTDN